MRKYLDDNFMLAFIDDAKKALIYSAEKANLALLALFHKRVVLRLLLGITVLFLLVFADAVKIFIDLTRRSAYRSREPVTTSIHLNFQAVCGSVL